MAEIVISKLAEAIVSHSVERITDLLVHEAVSLKNVKGDVEKFIEELKRIQCFLEDADRKQHRDKRVCNWIKEIKQVSEEMEDVIDIYITKSSASKYKFIWRWRLKKEINSIQEKLDIIAKSTQTYKIEFSKGEGTSSDDELLRDLRRTSPYDDDTNDVISMKNTEEALKKQLMEERDQLRIVSVVGMGGLGKTFLTKKVYNQSDVKQRFDCCAWVCISQQYVWEDVLYQILVQFEPDESKREKSRGLRRYELVDMLKEKLKEKRYLVVLDDIWDIKAWDGIKKAFPKGKCGSKVVFTTRNMDVASRADPSNTPIEPPFLSDDESWELLWRQVFDKDAFNGHKARQRLEEMGKYMARKCGGLPLAIVTLGGLLKTKYSISEWEEVQRDLNAYLNKIHSGQQYEGVNSILALSYNHLPYYLKPCFLYLGSFPEDEEIPKKELIQEWIAEGLIVQDTRQSRNQEKEIAERYLEELVERCMIQTGSRKGNFFANKRYRIHDLLRDLSLKKARDENFLSEVVQYQQIDSISSRRIIIHDGNIDLNRYLGLFFVFDFIAEIYLPNSIGKLRNLRTLYIQGRTNGQCILLPKETSMLTRLTYLRIDPLRLKKQSVESLLKLTNLEYLKIRVTDEQEAMLILKSPIIRSGKLRSLRLILDEDGEGHTVSFQSFQTISDCRRLYRLVLYARLQQPIDCLQHLPASLSKLILSGSRCEKDPMPVLEKLPNLRHLQLLMYSYVGSHMVCSVHGFPKLETLLLRLDSLKEWDIEKDSMPSLKILTLAYLPDLRMIPEGIKYITTLTLLDIFFMHEDFKKRVRSEGEDFYKVCHIPSIETDID